MLTAHLPSGYCLGKINRWRGRTFAAAMVGAVLPDIDLIFFYFVDDKAIHHHRYWMHIPFFWAVMACVALPFLWKTRYKPVAIAFFAAILMHLLLDSLGGGIMWLAPINSELWELVTVRTTQSHWILSFLLHWTIFFEVLIWVSAGYFFLRDRKRV